MGACVLGGPTILNFIHRYIRNGNLNKGSVAVDECGQVLVSLWAQLQQLCLESEIRWIVMGDPNQFSPIDKTWNGSEVKVSIWDSGLLQHRCGSLEVKLTKYRRGNDPALFSFYSSIPTSMATWNLKDVIKAFKEKFPLKSGDADYNLVISHEKRVALNHTLNNAAYEAYKRTGGREGRKKTIDETSKIIKKTQDYYCFPGQVLTGFSDCDKGI